MAEEDTWDQEIDPEQSFNNEENAYMDNSRFEDEEDYYEESDPDEENNSWSGGREESCPGEDCEPDYEEGVNDFPVSEVDWGEETWGREEDHGGDPWYADYPRPEFEEAPNGEEGEHQGEDSWHEDESQRGDYDGEESSPDESQTRSYHEENYDYEESIYGEGSELEASELEGAYREQSHHQDYENKTDSEISYGSGEWREEEYQEEAEFHISLREAERALQERAIEETWKEEEEPEFQYQDSEVHSIEDHQQDYETMSGLEEEDHQEKSCQDEVISEAGRDESNPRYINFSGRDQGPEAYLRWERDMDEWFQTNSVPEEEKTLIAEETLFEEAYLQWDQDANFRLDCDLPDLTWEEMKQLLHKEFVEEISTDPYYSRCQIPREPRRWITVASSKKSSSLEPMKLTKKMPQVSKAKKSKEALQIGKVETRAEQMQNAISQGEINISSFENLLRQPAAPHQGYTVSRSKPFEEG